jgi:hypothetical protein
MSKKVSIILFYALFITAFQNSSNIIASTSKLKIEQIQINNRFVNWSNSKIWEHINYENLGNDGLPVNLELFNNTDKISFRFNKSKNEKIKYRYKLLGQDTSWKNSNNSEWVKFDNLKNGKYCFVLQEIENNKVTQVIKFNFFKIRFKRFVENVY